MMELNKILTVPLGVTIKNDLPAIELRKHITDKEIIQMLVRSAVNSQPIIIYPHFTNKIIAMSNLIEKGILYINKEDGQYYFLE